MSEQLKKAGVFGWPVGHSLSPRLHGYWLQKYKIKGSYEALAVKPEDWDLKLKALALDGFCGVNLTVPHKETALPFLDHIDPVARQIGAVNTIIVRDGGKLEGRNTDIYGFTQNLLAAGFKPANRPVVLLGAGGAARGATAALIAMGFKDIRVTNRTRANAETIAGIFPQERITVHEWGDGAALQEAMLLVNATILGMQKQPPLQIALEHLPKDAWVMDMVYAPLETDLLKQARARGNKAIDGLGMLLHQGRPAFKAFFGVDPEVDADLRRYVLEGA